MAQLSCPIDIKITTCPDKRKPGIVSIIQIPPGACFEENNLTFPIGNGQFAKIAFDKNLSLEFKQAFIDEIQKEKGLQLQFEILE